MMITCAGCSRRNSSRWGTPSTTAANGAAALEAIDKEPPALVLTDLKMPGMSGMELLEQIRRDYPEIPVVIITAFGTIQSAVQAMRSGAYDYLTKPIDYEELGLAVSRVLGAFPSGEEVRNSVRALIESTASRISSATPKCFSRFSTRPRGPHKAIPRS